MADSLAEEPPASVPNEVELLTEQELGSYTVRGVEVCRVAPSRVIPLLLHYLIYLPCIPCDDDT